MSKSNNDIIKCAFISGHIDLSLIEFNQYYKKKIDNAIELGHHFVIGDAKGADSLAQSYLNDLCNNKSSDMTKDRVIIYHMFTKPMNNKGKYKDICDFKSQNQKDKAMTLNSDYDIAYVRSPEITKRILEAKGIKYDPKRKSGTQRNLDRRDKLNKKVNKFNS